MARGRPAGPKTVKLTARVLPVTEARIKRRVKAGTSRDSIGKVLDAKFNRD